jgi:hypothetical protein
MAVIGLIGQRSSTALRARTPGAKPRAALSADVVSGAGRVSRDAGAKDVRGAV